MLWRLTGPFLQGAPKTQFRSRTTNPQRVDDVYSLDELVEAHQLARQGFEIPAV